MKARSRANSQALGHAIRRQAMNDWGKPLDQLISKTSTKPKRHLRSLNPDNPDDYHILLTLDEYSETTLFDECQEQGVTPWVRLEGEHTLEPTSVMLIRREDGMPMHCLAFQMRQQRYWTLDGSYTR